jgi:hypothetical protein
MQDRDGNALLKWAALAVPGLAAGIGWTAASGYPAAVRVLCGVAAGCTIYALLHCFLKGRKRN